MLQTAAAPNNNPAPAGSFHEPVHSGRRRENLIGRKHHELEIISFSRTEKQPGRDRLTHWNASCTCGTIFEISGRQFKKRKACRRCEHIETFKRSFRPSKQQKFKLTGFSHYQVSATGAQGRFMWNCVCTCGQNFKVSSNHLKNTFSCPKYSRLRVTKNKIGRQTSRKKYQPTRKVIALLNECYSYKGPDLNKHKKAPTLQTISAKTGWHQSALRDLATELGLSQTLARPLRPWNGQEIATLKRLRNATLSGIKDALRRQQSTRSRNEIRNKLIELTHSEHPDRYTLNEIQSLLGLIKHKKLPTLLRPVNDPKSTKRQPYTRTEIKTFILTHPDQYELAKVDKVFFTMLILKDSFTQITTATT